jgi:UDP-N-acetylmuramate--alanine ligase
MMEKFGNTKKIHLVGIGGIGMSGIAEILLGLGYEVSGSDLTDSPDTTRITDLGAEVFSSHKREHIGGADVVVYSSAVSDENPEIVEARERRIPVIPRAEMLSELMRYKYGVVVAGAHGKTTTTSMIASVLTCGNLDPTVLVGGRLDILGSSNAKLGTGDILVAESDESDGSFMTLTPTIAVVTNIDLEHIEYYGDMDALRQSFVDFVNKIPFYGMAFLCIDNEEVRNIIPRITKRYFTYGMSYQADIRATEIERNILDINFEIIYKNRSLGRVVVGMPGNHNVQNALAAVSVGLELGIDVEDIKKGLVGLGCLERRFQIKGEKRGVIVIDDYGHHPAEISATLETAKECWPEKRLVVIFQPHRYSRVKSLFDRFVMSFDQADLLIVAPIYSAWEEPIQGVDAEWLHRGIQEHGHREAILCHGHDEIVRNLLDLIKPGDVVITLGAGDINNVGEELLKMLE